MRAGALCGVVYLVLTSPKAEHPWAKYYAERGTARPNMADFPRRASHAPGGNRAVGQSATAPKQSSLSRELAAAVAAASASVASSASSATPFLTPVQKEQALRAEKRARRIQHAKLALAAAVALVALHFVVTRLVYRAPTQAALLAHVQALPEAVLPLFSSVRQPLQADGVVITQADQIDAQHFRYVATVTLRLRKPLYIPAVTNGTVNYRRLQEALHRARDQEMRSKLFAAGEAPDAPTLPLLLQRTHQAGEALVVRVPFIARRFGWTWRIEAPQLGLRMANRLLQGDSLERYADRPYLIFGVPATLAEIRRRTMLANDYVRAVAQEVQRHANVEAVADSSSPPPALAHLPAQPSLADLPAHESLADVPAQPAPAALSSQIAHLPARPAIDPDAPAVLMEAPAKFFSAPPRTPARR